METSLDRVMQKDQQITVSNNHLYFGEYSPRELLERFGSPLYVYSESVLRNACRSLKGMVTYPHVDINYSVKANNNLQLLRIVREEGFRVDAMSPGEMYLEELAGFAPEDIFFISNNASTDEFQYAVDRGILVSVDSLGQLKRFGNLFPGHKVAVRINPGKGAGHHEKVITAGEKSKFGIPADYIDEVKKIAQQHQLVIAGLNMHIGSNYMEPDTFLQAVDILLNAALTFPDLEMIDIGGGLGIPYRPDEQPLDLTALGQKLDAIFEEVTREYGRKIRFLLEPGRFVAAQSGILLTRVETVKRSTARTFVGTDSGFNHLIRPMVYGSYHEIVNCNAVQGETRTVDVSGNICESGDLFARDRELPLTHEGDVLAIFDAGAYGYSMASNYNGRLRPAEILLHTDGRISLIRRRDTLEDLMVNQLQEPIPLDEENLDAVYGA